MPAPPQSSRDPPPSEPSPDAVLKEYGEAAATFRLLTDIRFKLLAFLPIAAGAATALLSAGSSGGDAAQLRALALSLFGVAVTAALATYNARNDQLYDALVGRAAAIERELGILDGAFSNRPARWLVITLPLVRWRWPIEHRTPVAWIYGCSVALWTFSACAAAVQLAYGDDPVPRGVLAAALVPAVVLPAVAARSIGAQRKRRKDAMRADAATASARVAGRSLADLAEDDELLALCARLGDAEPKDVRARAQYYLHRIEHEPRHRLLEAPGGLVGAGVVALLSGLPAAWVEALARDGWSSRAQDDSARDPGAGDGARDAQPAPATVPPGRRPSPHDPPA